MSDKGVNTNAILTVLPKKIWRHFKTFKSHPENALMNFRMLVL